MANQSGSITITVTQEDIDKGFGGNSQKCPIALAVKRQLPESEYVSVSSYVTVNEQFWGMPIAARDFVFRFDAGLTVEPFTFEMWER